jgi:hypothetical protein
MLRLAVHPLDNALLGKQWTWFRASAGELLMLHCWVEPAF